MRWLSWGIHQLQGGWLEVIGEKWSVFGRINGVSGDIEEIAEKEIIKTYKKEELNATVLKVAHHGSKTSSTEEFIKKVNPKVALIGVGKNNKFGHPNEQIIERLNKFGVKIYRTDNDGEICISVGRKGRIKINKFIK